MGGKEVRAKMVTRVSWMALNSVIVKISKERLDLRKNVDRILDTKCG